MTREEFRKLTQDRVLLLDGATGSNLMKRGMPSGVCPEKWMLEHKETVRELQEEFIEAGADILYAPTFTCNRVKLEEYGLEDELETMNAALTAITRKAVSKVAKEKPVFIAGDITMTGRQLYPIGEMDFEELITVYKEQAGCLAEAGVDLFVVETMMSLQECRAAVLAVRETCDLPVMVTLTFHEDGRTLYGTDPATAAVVMETLGADAVGVNCSTGPDRMRDVVKIMRAHTRLPIIAKPNAGLPHLNGGQTVYDMEPEEFARETARLTEAGASILGGCCGTTPKHLEKLAREIKKCRKPSIPGISRRFLTTERMTLPIPLDGPFMIVGERINPTGKKALQAELLEGCMDLVQSMAVEQEERGASILDINMGMNGIDEDAMMQKAVYEVMKNTNLPLSIDSSHVHVIEHALRIYPGRALINSISMESEKLKRLIPIAKKYGAMFVLLPLSDAGLPKNLEEKKAIIHTVMDKALEAGLSKEDMIVDGLVATVGANANAALETLETIRYCKNELGLPTVCGLSNISFGLPERAFVNSAFLTMAIQDGLTMAIANPSQDLLVNIAFAADLLLNKEAAAVRYIDQAGKHPLAIAEAKKEKQIKQEDSGSEEKPAVYEDVLKGNSRNIISHVKQLQEEGMEPSQIIDTMLIPAINETGRLFDQQIYFLPQLISSAETMKAAIDYLEPMLKKDENEKPKGTIVMATVEGDIHDIGKNLVVLMLKNYGYRVIDLGKDVPAETILKTAEEEKADIIGLSALMTTTMMQMKHIVKLVRERNLPFKVIIGGAVITEGFAREIGADGYSKDAQEAVTVVKRLLEETVPETE